MCQAQCWIGNMIKMMDRIPPEGLESIESPGNETITESHVQEAYGDERYAV